MALSAVLALLSLGALALSLEFLHVAADLMPSTPIEPNSLLSYDMHLFPRLFARIAVLVFIAASVVLADSLARLTRTAYRML